MTLFSKGERSTPVFMRLMKHLDERLNHLRNLNDAPNTLDKKNELVGRIAEIKGLLDLDKELENTAD